METKFSFEMVDGSGRAGGNHSLALDESGTPHIAYVAKPDNAVMLARRGADGWTVEELPTGAFSDLGNNDRVRLAIDSGGNPHIAYVDRESSHLIYGVKNGKWVFETVPTDTGLFPSAVNFVSFQLHPGRFEAEFRDTPNFAYHERSKLGLGHATKVGGTWRKHVISIEEPVQIGDVGNIFDAGLYTCLTFGGDDVQRIAYFFQRTTDGAPVQNLKLATFVREGEQVPEGVQFGEGVEHAGGLLLKDGWVHEFLEHDVQSMGETASMASGSLGLAFIAYLDVPSMSLKAWIRNPSESEQPRKEVVASGIGRETPSVADKSRGRLVSRGRNLRVAYADSELRLKFAMGREDGTWSVQTVDGRGSQPSLAYDNSGHAHIAYMGEDGLKYARGTE